MCVFFVFCFFWGEDPISSHNLRNSLKSKFKNKSCFKKLGPAKMTQRSEQTFRLSQTLQWVVTLKGEWDGRTSGYDLKILSSKHSEQICRFKMVLVLPLLFREKWNKNGSIQLIFFSFPFSKQLIKCLSNTRWATCNLFHLKISGSCLRSTLIKLERNIQ